MPHCSIEPPWVSWLDFNIDSDDLWYSARQLDIYPYEGNLFWLRDESLVDSRHLPAPELLAQEIVEDLQGG